LGGYDRLVNANPIAKSLILLLRDTMKAILSSLAASSSSNVLLAVETGGLVPVATGSGREKSDVVIFPELE